MSDRESARLARSYRTSYRTKRPLGDHLYGPNMPDATLALMSCAILALRPVHLDEGATGVDLGLGMASGVTTPTLINRQNTSIPNVSVKIQHYRPR